MNLKRRLAKLERVITPESKENFRVVTGCVVGTPNLSTSTCARTRRADGSLFELVHLDGGREGLTDEDLERWISGFPIESGQAG